MSRFSAWKPMEDIPWPLDLQAIHDDWEGFRLLLQDPSSGAVLRVRFDSELTYKVANEGDLLKTLANASGLTEWPLYRVHGGEFLKCFHEESCGIYSEREVLHLAVVSPEFLVEIVALDLPSVEWLGPE